MGKVRVYLKDGTKLIIKASFDYIKHKINDKKGGFWIANKFVDVTRTKTEEVIINLSNINYILEEK